MTRDTTPRCVACGWTGKLTSAAMAASSLRKHSCVKHAAKVAARDRGAARQAAVDRNPKPCPHKETTHEHGTHACYVLDRCRCAPCAQANAAYERERSRTHAYGRWDHLIDAEPVRAHIRTLQAAGMGTKQIRAAAGISGGALTKLVWGVNGRPPSRRVRKETATAILAVQPRVAAGARVDSSGTRRRLQALLAVGWSISQIAARSGLDRQRLDGALSGHDVLAETCTGVVAAYDALWDQPPAEHDHRSRIAAARSRNRARAEGWLPPMAWDDDTIDDPEASPAVVPISDGKKNGSVHVDDIEWLLRSGGTAESIARRLGVQPDSVKRVLYRAGRTDLVAKLSEAS